MKLIFYYSILFVVVLFANHLYDEYNSPKFIQLNGDFSALGITRSSPIVTYTAKWCDACKALKKQFEQQGVPYLNIDIDDNTNAKSDLNNFEVKGIPVVIIEDTLFVGYNPTLIQNRLDKFFKVSEN